MTWLGMQGECPQWFRRYSEPVIGADKRACGIFTQLLRQQSPQGERRTRRRHEKALGNWIPHTFDTFDPDTIAFLRNPSGFILDLGEKPAQEQVSAAVFGRERMVILHGKSDYKGLSGRSKKATQLRSAAVNVGGGLRVTVHGWCEKPSFRKICRKNPDIGVGLYGWLLPATPRFAIPPGVWTKHKLIGGMFNRSLHLRYVAPLSPYCPAPRVSEMLTHADDGWKMPAWCDHPAIRDLMRPEEQLAWQLAAQFNNLYGDLEPGSTQETWLAEVAVMLSHWVRGQHANELRMLYPGPDTNPVDPISCGIVDQLQVSQKSERELVRGLRGVATAKVKETLKRIQTEGWVERLDCKRWKLNFPDPPNLSEKLSEILP
ncbi:hypothetical protein HZ994_02375 [Akkermansiaceae bacterium]|nr:hypothetical protein HZ994_02375 [Akkermansiaceae bacterium]